MKKNLLFKIVMLLAVLTITINCKDYDDDIDHLQDQVNVLKEEVRGEVETDYNAKIDAVKADLSKAQTDLEDVKAIADNAATTEELQNAIEESNVNTKAEIKKAIDEAGVSIESARKAAIDAVKSEMENKYVTKVMYEEFKKDVLAKIEAATSADELDNIVTDINSLEGRVSTLEGLLKIKEDGTSETWDELAAKVDANESSIKSLIESGIDKDKFNELLEEMGLNLSDFSNKISSLVVLPDYVADNSGALPVVLFTPLNSDCGEIVPSTEIKYVVNPSTATADQIDVENLRFRYNDPKVLTKANNVDAKAEFVSLTNGILTVRATVETAKLWSSKTNTENRIDELMLEVPMKDSETIVSSDWVKIDVNPLEDLIKISKNPVSKFKCLSFNETESGAKALNVDNTDDQKLIVQLPFDGSVNLIDSVETSWSKGGKCTSWETMREKYGLVYKFDLMDESGKTPIVYDLGQNETNQQEFIELKDGNLGTINAKVYTVKDSTYAAIDRTPIVRVTLVSGDNPSCAIKQAFIKVNIVEKMTNYEPIVATFVAGELGEICDDFNGGITVKQMNEQIYNVAGLSKSDFHAIYGTATVTSEVGTIEEVKDPADTESWIIKWSLTADELWKTKGKENKIVIKYTATGHPDVIITAVAPVFSVDAVNFTESQLIDNYWNEAKTYVKHNVAVPVKGSTDSSTSTWRNNINAAFVTNADKSLKLPAGINNYEYVFAPAANQISAKDENGNPIAIRISSDGKELLTNGVWAARIQDFQTNVGDLLIYNEDNEIGKYLLNVSEDYMWANLMIKSYACDDVDKKLPVKINGKNMFTVHFLRPLKIAGVSSDNFVDGVDFGADGSVLNVVDVVALSDWRDYKFSTHPNYYAYYGVTSIIADVANITTDINGEKQALPSTLEVEQVIDGTNPALPTGADFPYGVITYKNNGTTVEKAFNMFIPVKVTYKWGEVASTVITVPVKTTVGQ